MYAPNFFPWPHLDLMAFARAWWLLSWSFILWTSIATQWYFIRENHRARKRFIHFYEHASAEYECFRSGHRWLTTSLPLDNPVTHELHVMVKTECQRCSERFDWSIQLGVDLDRQTGRARPWAIMDAVEDKPDAF